MPRRTKEGKDVYIETGSGSFDGIHSFTGWPLKKTNVARAPRGDEVICMNCSGGGWDANSGGGVFICPECNGIGVQDGSGLCVVCGHKRRYHYADCDCSHGYRYMHEFGYRFLHPSEKYDINKYPCKCHRYYPVGVETGVNRK